MARRFKINLFTYFIKALKYTGIKPSDCLVIEKKVFDDIAMHGNDTEILFNINFKEFNINEKRLTTVQEIRNLIKDGKAITRYNERIQDVAINIDRNDLKKYK